jgi:hypothetical protein
MHRSIWSLCIPVLISLVPLAPTPRNSPRTRLDPVELTSAAILPPDQVVSIDHSDVAFTRPADGRIRGYGFSALVAGVAAVDSAGPSSDPVSAGSLRHLVVFSLDLTTVSASDGLGDGAAPPLSADISIGGSHLAINTSGLRRHGEATYAVSVPNGSTDVDLQLTAADLTSTFSLTTLHRVANQPTVLYRDPTLPDVNVKSNQSVVIPVEAPEEDFTGEEILEVKSVILTEFEPGNPSVHPDDPGEAYLAVVGTDAEDADPPPGYGTGSHFVDGFSGLPPSDLTLTLPGDQVVTAAQSGSTTDGLLSGTYYFVVPANVTAATLSVAPGTVSGSVYDVSTGVSDNITFPQPAVFTVNLPPPPQTPTLSTSTSTLPVLHNDPAARLVSGTQAPVGRDWPLIAWVVVVGVLLGLGVLVSRRFRRRQSGARVRPTPFRPLVPLEAVPGVGSVSARRTTPVLALPPGSRPPGANDQHSVGRSSTTDHPTSDGTPVAQASPAGASRASAATRALELLVLGPVEVHGWKHRPRRRIVTALLCYLALHPDRPVSADQLLTTLWPLGSSRKEATRASLHTYMSDLRRALPDGMLPDAASSDGYLISGGVPTDWGTFLQLVLQAKDAGPGDATQLLIQALSLVRGVPFAGSNSDMFEWVASEHHLAAMEVAITECAHTLSSRRLRTGDPEGAAEALRIGLLAVPDSYVLHADTVRSTRAGGDPAALRRAWRSARSALGAEGVEALRDELGSDTPFHGPF